MAEQSVHAIVLRRRDQGESDRRLTLLCREQGKLEAIARGSRKSGSRLAGISEPLCEANLHLSSGPRRAYVTQAVPLQSFRELRTDYERLTFGLALAEIVEAIAVSEQGAAELFDLFKLSLTYLSLHENPGTCFLWSALQLMDHEGRQPSWNRCVETGVAVAENPAWVSPMVGGYLSAGAHRDVPDRFQVRAEVLLGLAALTPLERPPAKMKFLAESIRLVYDFWVEYAHKPLPATVAVLQSLNLVS